MFELKLRVVLSGQKSISTIYRFQYSLILVTKRYGGLCRLKISNSSFSLYKAYYSLSDVSRCSIFWVFCILVKRLRIWIAVTDMLDNIKCLPWSTLTLFWAESFTWSLFLFPEWLWPFYSWRTTMRNREWLFESQSHYLPS